MAGVTFQTKLKTPAYEETSLGFGRAFGTCASYLVLLQFGLKCCHLPALNRGSSLQVRLLGAVHERNPLSEIFSSKRVTLLLGRTSRKTFAKFAKNQLDALCP